MKILVAYFSATGNTKKIAKAIHDEASLNHEVVLHQIGDVALTEINGYDVVILGAACHDSDLARPLKNFLSKLPQNPSFKLAGFFTHATYMPGGSARKTELFNKWAGKCGASFETTCQEKGIHFLGYFHCMGVPSKPIEEFIHREIIVSEDEWKTYLPEVKTHPNAEDLLKARKFVNDVIAKYSEV